MADYYSLLAKLLDGLPDATPPIRSGVYDRARRALAEQLKTVQPQLTAEEIAREGRDLEDAIHQLEGRYSDGGSVAPAAPIVIPAQRDESGGAVRPTAPEEARPEPVAIRRGGRRRPPLALLLGLALLAIPVAVVGWLWREDRASPGPAAPPVTAPAQVAQPEIKYGERVAGGAGEARPPAPATPPASGQPPALATGQTARVPPTAPTAPPPAAGLGPGSTARAADPAPAAEPAPVPPPPGSDLAVAQRALIFEENQIDPQQPIISSGRAVWRLDAINGGQGQPLETVVRGRVDLPGAGLSLAIVLRRNLDAALPASHTIELTFSMTGVNGSAPRVVRDVALPQMRPEETIRGVPVAGLPVPVKENVFLIGLSDLKGDIERNTELLLRRNWMELPIRFASGQKAALLFDKGVSGERVFLDAFRQWGQAP